MSYGNLKKFEVIVSIADTSSWEFDRIVTELQNCGLEITGEPLANLGMVTGLVTPNDFAALVDVPGVCGVDPAGAVQIPPPEADVQ